MDVVITCSASAQSSVVAEAPAANVLTITPATEPDGEEQQPPQKKQKVDICSFCTKNRQIPTNKYDLNRSAKCCTGCAKENDLLWYKAHQASKGICGFCENCNQIPTNKFGLERRAKCCTSCAEEFDREWFDAYQKSKKKCKHCKKNKIPNNKYGFKYKSEYCRKCAKEHDPPYHTAYEAAQGFCQFCNKNNKIPTQLRLSRKAKCCISCAKVHDGAWYKANEDSKGICKFCKNTNIPLGQYGFGRRTEYCVTCARDHDEDWYQAYKVYTGICNFCNINLIPKAKCGLDRKAKCCNSCAKKYDSEWFDAWRRTTRCKYSETSACDAERRADLDGYCGRCFSYLYPNDKRARYLRYKERAVAKFVVEKFPEVPWRTDMRIPGGSSRRRPDIFIDLGAYALSVEVDEFEHAAYSCVCENKKMMEHFVDAKSKPHYFIRFNPDAFWSKGEKHAGCWGKRAKNREPFVPPKKCKEWEERLNVLSETIQSTLTQHPQREVELIHLFYSDETWVDEEEKLHDDDDVDEHHQE